MNLVFKKHLTDTKLIKYRYTFHHSTPDWGEAIFIMEKRGKAFARISWYTGEPTTAHFDMLSVEEKYRKHGLGTELQILREEIAIERGFTEVELWVKKDMWMHEWYQRRGFIDIKEDEYESNMLWMKKKL